MLFAAQLLLAAGYVGMVAWAIGDAQKRGHSGCLVLVFFCLLGPLAVFLWLVVRPTEKLIERRAEHYTSAEDAMAAARRLDALGEWEAAIRHYQSIATIWPEHARYAETCLEEARQKIALAAPPVAEEP